MAVDGALLVRRNARIASLNRACVENFYIFKINNKCLDDFDGSVVLILWVLDDLSGAIPRRTN